jgi:hypothetical protein
MSIDMLIIVGHGVHGSTVYAGVDTKTGDLVAISEWVLKWRHVGRKSANNKDVEDKEGESYMKQVTFFHSHLYLASFNRLKVFKVFSNSYKILGWSYYFNKTFLVTTPLKNRCL